MMRRMRFFVLAIGVFSFLLTPFLSSIYADDGLEETTREREEKQRQLELAQQQLNQAKQYEGNLSSQLSQMRGDLSTAYEQYNDAASKVEQKEQELAAKEEEQQVKEAALNRQKEFIAARIRSLYKNTQASPFTAILLSENFSQISQDYFYRVVTIYQDELAVRELTATIDQLAKDTDQLAGEKEQLKEDQDVLAAQKVALQSQANGLSSQIASTQNSQQQFAQQMAGLQTDIANLSQKEQEILLAKAAASSNTIAVVGDKVQNYGQNAVPPTDQKYYSFWIYGYPHRVGMNQYGAYGRAMAGQNYQQILQAYYGGATIETVDVSGKQIHVVGNGDRYYDEWIPFEETYMLGISEMPVSWPLDALKAQVIAARTYAMKATRSFTGSIQPNQNGQVYREINVTDSTRARWKQAVEETKGMVLTYNGDYIYAVYSSTAGGATISAAESGAFLDKMPYTPGIADTDATGKAFDGPDYADSPCYHSLNICYFWFEGRRVKDFAQPWFTAEEVEILLNITQLDDRGAIATQFSHSYFYVDYTYKPVMPLRSYVDYRSRTDNLKNAIAEKLAGEGKSYFSGLQSVAVTLNPKSTEKIIFSNAGGSVTLDAQVFRMVYNIFAPANDELKTTKFDVVTSQ